MHLFTQKDLDLNAVASKFSLLFVIYLYLITRIIFEINSENWERRYLDKQGSKTFTTITVTRYYFTPYDIIITPYNFENASRIGYIVFRFFSCENLSAISASNF